MSDESKSRMVRNAMLGVVVVVMLGLVGCLDRNDSANMAGKPDPSDVIDIVVAKESLAIPEQLKTELEGVAAESIVFIDRERRLIPFSVDGAPRDLCKSSGSSTCKLEIPSRDLMIRLASDDAGDEASDCGTCVVGGIARSCSKSTQKRDCKKKLYSCGDATCVSN